MPWIRIIIAALLPLPLAGCASLGLSRLAPSRAESLERMDPALIQADTMGFADRFVTTMTGVYDDLERRAPMSPAKDAAHQLKTDLALGAISNAVNPHPIAGLMDMVVLVTLLRQIAEDPSSNQMFGPAASTLLESLNRQESDVRLMASRYFTDAQLDELGELAARWHRAHPGERAVSHVHLADLPEANRPPEVRGKHASSVFREIPAAAFRGTPARSSAARTGNRSAAERDCAAVGRGFTTGAASLRAEPGGSHESIDQTRVCVPGRVRVFSRGVGDGRNDLLPPSRAARRVRDSGRGWTKL